MSEVELQPIVDIRIKIADTPQIQLRGLERFPFTIHLPPWLPSSLVLAEAQKDTEIMVEYILVVEYIPIDPINIINCCTTPPLHKYDLRWGPYWLTSKIELSKINSCKLINVCQPPLASESVPHSFPLTSSVGGFMGILK